MVCMPHLGSRFRVVEVGKAFPPHTAGVTRQGSSGLSSPIPACAPSMTGITAWPRQASCQTQFASQLRILLSPQQPTTTAHLHKLAHPHRDQLI